MLPTTVVIMVYIMKWLNGSMPNMLIVFDIVQCLIINTIGGLYSNCVYLFDPPHSVIFFNNIYWSFVWVHDQLFPAKKTQHNFLHTNTKVYNLKPILNAGFLENSSHSVHPNPSRPATKPTHPSQASHCEAGHDRKLSTLLPVLSQRDVIQTDAYCFGLGVRDISSEGTWGKHLRVWCGYRWGWQEYVGSLTITVERWKRFSEVLIAAHWVRWAEW